MAHPSGLSRPKAAVQRHAIDLLRSTLPATHGQLRLELVEAGLDLGHDGRLTVRLSLSNDGSGERREETVRLIPPGQDPNRVRAYVEAWARSLPSLLACAVDRVGEGAVVPGMLTFPRIAFVQTQARTTAQFVEKLTDPGTLRAWAAAADAADAAQSVRDVCQDLGLGRHADALVALCRTSIDLYVCSDGTAAGRTRLGGSPDLPPGAVWPHRREHPMSFLGQFDLAEMSRCDDDRLLPPAGLLQLFADLTSDVAWDDAAYGPGVLVMIQPLDADELVTTPAPAGAQTFPRRGVIPSAGLSLPPLDSPFYRDLAELDLSSYCAPDEPGEEYAAWIGFLNEFHPPMDEDDPPRHRLLGYADPLQNDPWEQVAATEPGVPPAGWQLLAQIDSEPDALLGDNGLIYFFIPSDALDGGDFSRTRGVWQSY